MRDISLEMFSKLKTLNVFNDKFSDNDLIELINNIFDENNLEMLERLGLDDTDLNKPNEFDNKRFEGE